MTATTFRPLTQAMDRLEHAFDLGTSAEHPGLTDVLHSTAHHMGVLIDQLRTTGDIAIARIRVENQRIAALEAAAVQPDPGSST